MVLGAAAWSSTAIAQEPAEPSHPAAQPPSGTPAAPPSRGPLIAPGPTPQAGTAAPAQPAQPAPVAPATQPAQPAAPQGAAVVIDPFGDQQKLATQGAQRPSTTEVPNAPQDVYSEDWWGHTRPILELHGYFRTRAELFHQFTLGRHNAPGDPQNLWTQPLDQTYVDSSGNPHAVTLCGPGQQSAAQLQPCYDKTQSGANVRFRINPELHISDNLRIMSQIDALDNLVLGTTGDAYALQPASGGTTNPNLAGNGNGYRPAGNGYNGYAPLGVFTTTQGAPTAGITGYRNSIDVKRVWAEYMTPVGQLRFGRMPSHWGLGMVANAGDGIDSDYQTTTDRIMFVSGLKSMDLYFGGAWDFVSTGPTNASPYDLYGGQPYNTCNLCNVNEWVAFAARRVNPELQRLMLARGDVVVNGGTYWVYRNQLLDVTASQNPYTIAGDVNGATNRGLERRGAWAIIPDVWLQILWRKLRIEGELAMIYGEAENLPGHAADMITPYQVRQWGLATQTEYKAIEDKLHLGFGFGWASGDPWVEGLNPGSTGLQSEYNNGRGPISTFRFHPDYRVDLIFFRHILSRVEGAYYFRPSVDYDFLRNANGQKLGGGAAIIWSRASEFEQTPGNKRDLGVELDVSLYYQAKDGSLNDDPEKVGGFYTMLQYGVFFPLGGLSYLAGEQNSNLPAWDTSSAQTLRLFLGVVY